MESVFEQIKTIIDAEQKQLAEKRVRGELFNIFEVLGLTSNEVRTHSSLIAELLNPQGSHGMGAIPLSLFLEEINNSVREFDFDVENASVSIEHFIGHIDEHFEEGGRIDILVESSGKAILIENKIYADDQWKQLIRYNKYAKQTYGNDNYVLLYLSLDRQSASDYSSKTATTVLEARQEYWPITYKEEIRSWLEACVSRVSDKPHLCVILRQYLNLILTLTSNMQKSNDDVIKTMMDHPSVVSKILILQDVYKQKVIKENLTKSFEDFAREKGLELSIEPEFLTGKRYSRLLLRKTEWNNASIIIEPDSKQGNYWIGIMHKRHGEVLKTEEHTLSILKDGTNDTIPFGSKWLPGYYRWMYDPRTIEDIISGEFMKVIGKLIIEIIKEAETIPGFAEL